MTQTNILRPLLEHYPGLKGSLPHVSLGALPTPVERLHNLEASIDAKGAKLFIKRDDLSGAPYGGNKVRKLEFILAHVLATGHTEVLTFGGAGSNHALATALYGQQLGIGCVSMLVDQPNACCVQRNLLMSLRAGVELHLSPGMITITGATLKQLFSHKWRTGSFPYLIPPGGTSPLGMIGFVNAAFELKSQVDNGDLPEPDYIYAASGSMGTVVGLMLGLKAAGLKTQVVAIRVTELKYTSMRKAKRLFNATVRLLRKHDSSFPLLPFSTDDFHLNHSFYGQAYGLYTPEAMNAVRLLHETSGMHLEGTYTGKTFAALLADIEAGKLDGKNVLFWNTHNSLDFSDEIDGVDYHDLPRTFYKYFEGNVQPLDCYRI